MKQFDWKFVVRIIVTIIGVLVISVSALFIFSNLTPFPQRFDKKTWRDPYGPPGRYAMHQDFLDHHHVIGMTKMQLIELLGQPDGDEKGLLTWNLGGAGCDDDNYLDFQLLDGKVVSFRRWGH